MRTLYDQSAVREITDRIHKLTPQAQRQWGKMNVSQMLAHCSAALEVATGEKHPPRLFMGRIFAPLAKPSFLSDEPFKKNYPTDKSFVMNDERDFTNEKRRLLEIINQFASAGPEKCTTHPHSFFGKLNPQEWSKGMYKHLDHHLRQFGV